MDDLLKLQNFNWKTCENVTEKICKMLVRKKNHAKKLKRRQNQFVLQKNHSNNIPRPLKTGSINVILMVVSKSQQSVWEFKEGSAFCFSNTL